VTLFVLSPASQAYVDGFKSGRSDKALGLRLRVSCDTSSPNWYVRQYSIGYLDGHSGNWMGQKRYERITREVVA